MMKVLAAFNRANVPLLLWGDPGRGKTSVISAFGKANGMTVETIVGSIREASDFLGLPIEVGGKVRYAPPAWAERLAEAPSGLLFLDELTCSSPSVQSAMLRVLQERQVGEVTLPPSVWIVAAANPPSVAVGGIELPAPVANRVGHLDYVPDVDRWMTGLTVGFDRLDVPTVHDLLGAEDDGRRAKVRGAVLSFLAHQRNLVHKMPSDPVAASRAWPSERSWTNAIAVASELGDEDATFLAISSCVGEAAATEYLAWLATADLYDPAEVLARPSMVEWASRPDRIFALMNSVVALVTARGDVRTWGQGMNVMVAAAKAGRPDVAYPATVALVETRPHGAEVPDKAREAFGDLMVRTGRWQRAAA